jgi:hypothetical protein
LDERSYSSTNVVLGTRYFHAPLVLPPRLLSPETRPLDQWYSTLFVHVPPDIMSLQFCTLKAFGV